MPKQRISVNIEGRNYTLITMDDIKYVQGIASEVSRHIHKTAQNNRQLDTRDCAILAALDFCDDCNKAMKRSNDIVAKADMIIKQSGDLNIQFNEYKEKLAETVRKNEKLEQRNKVLEEQLIQLLRENEQLKNALPKDSKAVEPIKSEAKKKNEKLLGYVPMKQGSLFEEESFKKATENLKITYDPKNNKHNKSKN
jgi:cell division protein ZapA